MRKYIGMDVTSLAKQALERPGDFGYWGKRDMFNTWGFAGILVHRDSDVLERSNYEVVSKDLREKYPDDFDVLPCSHWAVGHVDHLICRILKDENKGIEENNITEAFHEAMDWVENLRDYPVADESHFSEMEYEETLESIRNNIPSMVEFRGTVEETAALIYEKLMEMDVYIGPDSYYCPSDAEMLEAAYHLGLFDKSYQEEWDDYVQANNLAEIMWDSDEPHVVHRIEQDKLFD